MHSQVAKSKGQQAVLGLLQHIAKGVGVQSSLHGGAGGNMGDLKDELAFKQEQMQHSEMTLSHLQKELEKRQAELDKVATLDSKIGAELNTLTSRTAAMEADLITFAKVDGLRDQAAELKKTMLMEKQKSKNKRDALQQRVAVMQQRLEKQKQDVNDSEVFKKLDSLDQKLRAQGQNIYSINEFVTARERESDYESIQVQTNQLLGQINTFLIQTNV